MFKNMKKVGFGMGEDLRILRCEGEELHLELRAQKGCKDECCAGKLQVIQHAIHVFPRHIKWVADSEDEFVETSTVSVRSSTRWDLMTKEDGERMLARAFCLNPYHVCAS